jgi:hypothetical protein
MEKTQETLSLKIRIMKKLFQFSLPLIVSLFLTSCYYNSVYEEVEDSGPVDDISYQADILPLWGQCVGCHNGSEPPNLEDMVSYNELLNGYVVPGDANASILYKSLLGIDGVSLMPPGSQWPDTKINAVKDWINQGALNN